MPALSVPSRPSFRRCAPRLGAALVAAAALFIAPSAAHADAFGQLGSFLSRGDGDAQIPANDPPAALASDPTDGSFFVVDYDPAVTDPVLGALTDGRVRRFSPSGTLQATTATQELPGDLSENYVGTHYQYAVVDHAANRVYVLAQRAKDDGTGTVDRATRIVVLAEDTLARQADIPLPDPDGASGIHIPFGLARDPKTGQLLVGGYTADGDGHVVVQRVGTDGHLGGRFVDTADAIGAPLPNTGRLTNDPAVGLAVGPDGSSEILTNGTVGRVFRIAPDMSSVAGNASVVLNSEIGGAALSPDGGTLYSVDKAGGYPAVRGTSLSDGSTTAFYGGGTTSCTFASDVSNGHFLVAANADGSVLAVDDVEAGDTARILKFGAGGSGCPAPTASFKIGSSASGPVTVQKGSTLQLDASGSDLRGARPTEVDWDVDGSGAFATKVTGSPAALTLSTKALKVGTYDVSLRIHLSGSFGDPAVVKRTITVTAGTPTASFTASPRTPAAGGSVTFDASGSIDPTGSATGGPTNALKTYTWDFGDGSAVDTTSGKRVTHVFANSGSSSVDRKVTLKVTSADGVDSAPVSQTVTVGGTSGGGGNSGGGGGNDSGGGGTTPPSTNPPSSNPPSTNPPSTNPPPGGGTPPPATVPAGKAGLRFTAGASSNKVPLKVSCQAFAACNGKVVLTTTITSKKGKKTKVTIATVPLKIAAGQSTVVTVKLPSKVASALKHAHSLSVLAAITTQGSSATPSTASSRLTLKVATKKKTSSKKKSGK